METPLKRKESPNIGNLDEQRYRQVDLLSKKLAKDYGKLIFSTLVNRPSSGTDVTKVLFIIDDLSNLVTNQKLNEIKMSASESAYEGKLSIESDAILASDFWDRFQRREEATLKLLRDYLVVHDNGFIYPLQDMLVTGKLRPTKESMRVYYVKAEQSMKDADKHVSRAVLDLYWAVIDAGHAAIMVAGITPPSPRELAQLIKTELVARNLLHKRCSQIVERFYDIAKAIMHKERFGISGKEFDSYLADADFFIKEVSVFVKEHAKD
ncbi:hypothetical protein ACFL3V_03800 [Nanoarchaeota archaeon]